MARRERRLVIQDVTERIRGSRRRTLTLVDDEGNYLGQTDMDERDAREVERCLALLKEPPPRRSAKPKAYD